jgi:uncharacterized protein (DUF4415 family)
MGLYASFQRGELTLKKRHITMGETMNEEWDLSKMKSRPNPYAKRLKKQVTLRIDPNVVDYFKGMAEETGIPYQSLINLYLQDCVASQRSLRMAWES